MVIKLKTCFLGFFKFLRTFWLYFVLYNFYVIKLYKKYAFLNTIIVIKILDKKTGTKLNFLIL